jgi:hypothetical protein
MICLLQVFEQTGTNNNSDFRLSQRLMFGGVQKAQDKGLGGNPWQHLSDSSV